MSDVYHFNQLPAVGNALVVDSHGGRGDGAVGYFASQEGTRLGAQGVVGKLRGKLYVMREVGRGEVI